MAWYDFITQPVANIASGLLGAFGEKADRQAGQASSKRSTKYQKKFAQHGVQWRVDDARRAGINPLAALGANTTSYQPSHAFTPARKNYIGKALENMGQNTQRAQLALAGKQDRQLNTQILIEQLRTAKLTNDGIEIKLSQASNPQGIPVSSDPLVNAMNQQGQGNAGNNSVQGNAAIMVKPDSYTPMKQLGISSATSPLKKHYVDDHGWVWNILNQEAAESVESDNAAQLKMTVHQGQRWIAGSDRRIRPKIKIPPGYKLGYYRFMNQWRIIKDKPLKYYKVKHPKYYKIRR